MIPAERSLEWAAERRFLVRQKQAAERRIEELDELLAAFPPTRENGSGVPCP